MTLNEQSRARLLKEMRTQTERLGYSNEETFRRVEGSLENLVEWVQDCQPNAWETHGELTTLPSHILREALRECGALPHPMD